MPVHIVIASFAVFEHDYFFKGLASSVLFSEETHKNRCDYVILCTVLGVICQTHVWYCSLRVLVALTTTKGGLLIALSMSIILF